MLRTIALFCGATGIAAAQPPSLRGRVVDAQTREPLAGASVYGDDAPPVITAEDGTFVLGGRPTTITVIDGDREPAVVAVETNLDLVIALAPRPGEVIEVTGERQTAAPGGVKLSRSQITAIPGARGDMLSGVKNLPGIANNGSLTPLSSGLIIRGSSPETSRILVDGFEIPVLYHFLGVQSVVPSEMLAGLEYLPGSFGVGYGRASGGIVAATSRDEATTTGGFAELSFVNVAGLVQGPIGKSASVAVAARRSVFDAILPAVLSADSGLDFTAYPRYYDYQAKLTYHPSSAWLLSAFLFGSDDRVELASDADNAMDPTAAGKFSNATSFTRAIASARYRRPGLVLTNAVSAYTDTNHFEIGTARYLLLDRDGVATRSELAWDPAAKLRVVAGAEADFTRTAYNIKFTRPPREGDPRGPNFTRDALLETTGDNTFRDLGAWASATTYPVRAVEITAGVRVDAYLRNDDVVVQPRGQVIWHVVDGSTLRVASGLYTRPPEYLDQGLQPDLDPERSVQSSIGAEQRLTPELSVTATAFYNRMSDLLVLPADRADPASLGGYQNIGSGESRGIELLLSLKSADVFGWLGYTGSIAKRRDADGMPTRRFDYDQTHNLIAVASWQLSRAWRVGGRFQLTTGKPYTPVTGALYQADVDLYLPSYGAPNSERVALQHQLDLRVDRTWAFARWKLSAYLDISNVYVNAAAIDYQYNFDYTRRTAVTTLPIIPSIGIRGEL
ncbi:MAG: TonB-dependent receptor plug domain-containing protein [Myxococcales bacterium]|nr:TonB-dependent receptor plug domain-containing protein [Myxococcales bacterium]